MEKLPLGQVLSWVSPRSFLENAFQQPPLLTCLQESSVFSSRKFSCQFSSLDGQKFGVSGHSHEWLNEGLQRRCASFSRSLPLRDGWVNFSSCLLWHGEHECFTEDLGVQSAAVLVFSLFLSSFPVFPSNMQLKSNTL